MRFFILKTDKQFDTAPNILNWYPVVDTRFIRRGSSHRLPKRELLYIRSNPNTVFTDVIHRPFFLGTSVVRDVIKMYEPVTPFKELVLLDRENALTEVYYLPILEHCDCLAPQSELNMDRSVIKRAVIDMDAVGDKSIFYIDRVSSLYVVARLDLVESLLRRSVRGMGLEPVDIMGQP